MESAISEKVDKVLFLIHNLQAILSFIDLKHTHTQKWQNIFSFGGFVYLN